MNIYAKVVNGVVTDARDFPSWRNWAGRLYTDAPDYVLIGHLHDGTDFADELWFM